LIGIFLVLVIVVGLLIAADRLKLVQACFSMRKKSVSSIKNRRKGSRQQQQQQQSTSRLFSSSFRFQTGGNGFFGNITREKAGLEGGYQKSSELRLAAGGTTKGSGSSGSSSSSMKCYEMVPLGDGDADSGDDSDDDDAGGSVSEKGERKQVSFRKADVDDGSRTSTNPLHGITAPAPAPAPPSLLD
jgi:hypothetical protein